MLNELIAVVVSPFQGEKKVDTNGKTNVWLTPVAGKIPSTAMVVAGTVAEQAGLVTGKTLLVQCNEGEAREVADTTGALVSRRQFNYTVLGEVKPLEIIGLRKELGIPDVITTASLPINGGNTETPSLTTSSLNGVATKEGPEALKTPTGATKETVKP